MSHILAVIHDGNNFEVRAGRLEPGGAGRTAIRTIDVSNRET
jgi:hypothetical protein